LNFLDTCEFLVHYKIPPNDKTNLQLILAPFLESFWLNEKRWFIGCEYVLGQSTILLYTVPTNFDFYYYKTVGYAISVKNNNYHLIQRLQDDILTDVSVSSSFFIMKKQNILFNTTLRVSFHAFFTLISCRHSSH
jgi:hypothetical protein